MSDHRWVQMGGLAGIVYVVATVVSIGVAGTPPHQDASAASIIDYVMAHRRALVVSGIVSTGAFTLVLWWLGTVHHALRLRDDQSDPLASVVLASGIGAAILGVASNIPTIVLAMMAGQPGGLAQGPLVRALFDLQPAFGGMSFLLLSGFVFSMGVAFAHRGIVRSWLAWLTTADAIVLAVGGGASLAIGNDSGMASVGFFGLIGFALVILATSVALVARTIEPASSTSLAGAAPVH
jgi:hypothetical protein